MKHVKGRKHNKDTKDMCTFSSFDFHSHNTPLWLASLIFQQTFFCLLPLQLFLAIFIYIYIFRCCMNLQGIFALLFNEKKKKTFSGRAANT